MKKHIEILGILHIVYHAFGLLGAAAVLIFVGGAGIVSGDETAIVVLSIIALFVTGIMLVTSLPGIIGGIGLLKMKPWGRILTLVMGFLALLGIPFGTALGIYTIWALMNDETIKLIDEANTNN